MGFLNNRIIQILLAVCFIIALCMLVGLQFHMTAGTQGFNLGVDHTK